MPRECVPSMVTPYHTKATTASLDSNDIVIVAPSPLHWNESQSHIELTSSFCSSVATASCTSDEETHFNDNDSFEHLFEEDDSFYDSEADGESERRDDHDDDFGTHEPCSMTTFDDGAFYRQLVHGEQGTVRHVNLFRVHCYHTSSYVLGWQAIYLCTDDKHAAVQECAAEPHYLAPWFHYHGQDDDTEAQVQCTTLQLERNEYLVDLQVETRPVAFLKPKDLVVVQLRLVTSQDRVLIVGIGAGNALGHRYSRRRGSPASYQRIVALQGAIGYDGILRSLDTVSEPFSRFTKQEQQQLLHKNMELDPIEFHFDWMRHWLTNTRKGATSKRRNGTATTPSLQTDAMLSLARPTEEHHFNDWFLYQHLQAQPGCLGVRIIHLHCYTGKNTIVGLQAVYRSYFANGACHDTPARSYSPLFHSDTIADCNEDEDIGGATRSTLEMEPGEYIVSIRTRQDEHTVYQLKILTDRRKVTLGGSCVSGGAKEPIHPYYYEYQQSPQHHRAAPRRGVVALAGTIQAGALFRLGFVLATIPPCTMVPPLPHAAYLLRKPLQLLHLLLACDGTYGLSSNETTQLVQAVELSVKEISPVALLADQS